MKTWLRKYEWTIYAACADSDLHTAEYLAPDPPRVELDEESLKTAVDICRECKVRPECIEWAIKEKACAVMVAGVYLPDPVFKKELRLAYQHLQKLLPVERKNRGDL